ncbi:hypothetical protein BDW02DRAFT_226658 [Decorospora gaudefroyi]|uniref:Uncharacterized protein n=1 Tax=Decorospora gaudefroyi TaxID=184978 RepID=A0A6A5JYH3_9PLEO|nr:hypothetical protein BDW02DRAFT_226658 [Decorospora gaudefroyi]
MTRILPFFAHCCPRDVLNPVNFIYLTKDISLPCSTRNSFFLQTKKVTSTPPPVRSGCGDEPVSKSPARVPVPPRAWIAMCQYRAAPTTAPQRVNNAIIGTQPPFDKSFSCAMSKEALLSISTLTPRRNKLLFACCCFFRREGGIVMLRWSHKVPRFFTRLICVCMATGFGCCGFRQRLGYFWGWGGLSQGGVKAQAGGSIHFGKVPKTLEKCKMHITIFARRARLAV